jgi:hypothetical protein
MFQLTRGPVLSDVVVKFLYSIILLTQNGNFCTVPPVHSVKDI